MKLGVRLHDLGRNTPEALAKRAKEIGFDGVQLVIQKAFTGEETFPVELNYEKVINIKNIFETEGLEIFMLGAYFNPVHSNKEKVRIGIENFKNHLHYERDFNAYYVGSETGSYSDDPWIYHPKNRTEEGFLEMKKVFKNLCNYAETNNAKVAYEGAFGHICYQPEVLKRLYDEINSETLYFTLDLYNYLDISNYKDYLYILENALNVLKGRIVIVHLKDFIIKDNKLVQVDLGKGILDYEKVLKLYLDNIPDAYYIFEGCSKEGMQESYNFIRKLEEKLK